MTPYRCRLAKAALLITAFVVPGEAPLRAGPKPPTPSARPAPPAPPRKKAQKKKEPEKIKPKKKLDREPSDEELLNQLEKDVEEAPQKGQARRPTSAGAKALRFIQSMNPDISAIASLAGAYYYDHALKGEGNVVPGGGHDPGKTGFHLQEIELALQAAVDPFFRMDVFLSISPHGLHIEEGYLTSLGLGGGFQLRLGQFFHRFGRFNQKHLHTWSFVDAMVPAARLLGAEGLTSLAGEVSWMMPLPWYAVLSVSITGPSGLHSFVGDGQRKEGFHLRHPGHLGTVFHLAQYLELSDSWGLSLGLSYALGPNNSGGYDRNMTQLYGADLFLKYRNLRRPYSEIRLTVEGYGRLMQVPEDQLFDWGVYAMASFRLSKRWWLAFRYDMVEISDPAKLQAFGFTEPSSSSDYPKASDDQHRGSVALTLQLTHFSQFRIQYNNNWTRRADAGGTGDFKLSHEVFLQLQANIGSHGAHPY